jgi:hypothetical protein
MAFAYVGLYVLFGRWDEHSTFATTLQILSAGQNDFLSISSESGPGRIFSTYQTDLKDQLPASKWRWKLRARDDADLAKAVCE